MRFIVDETESRVVGQPEAKKQIWLEKGNLYALLQVDFLNEWIHVLIVIFDKMKVNPKWLPQWLEKENV